MEPARSDSFSYNGRNELTASSLGAAPYGYSYDNIGNRKTAREPAGELAYAANGLNQYTGIEESGEAPFVPTYDASGNQTLIKTSTGIWTAVYNAANRAVSFTSRDGATVVECGYDYQGRRYMKKVTQNGTVTSHERYLYRGYLQIAALDMLNSRNVLRTLLWDPLEPTATRPLALAQDASLYCYGMDFNKNVTEVFDAQGNVAAAYDYSPYGQAASTGNIDQPEERPALVISGPGSNLRKCNIPPFSRTDLQEEQQIYHQYFLCSYENREQAGDRGKANYISLFDGVHKDPSHHSLFLESMKMVTGPSLIRETCISAPNSPLSTLPSSKDANSFLNSSYRGMARSGLAARMKEGLFPFRVEACSVNWLTTNTLPLTSLTERFIFPSASEKMRMAAALLASQRTSSSVSASSMPARISRPDPTAPAQTPPI